MTTGHEVHARFEVHQRPDGRTECWVYLRDATPEEAERAIQGVSLVPGKLRVIFEGDIRAAEEVARQHGVMSRP